jgi:hypothetical protein
MKRLIGFACSAFIAGVVIAYPAWTQTARPSPDTVEAHIAAGKNAAGGRDDTPDFYGLHAGEVGGAFLFQSRYGSRIVMNDWDMVEESVNGYPTGKPKRDIVPTDGMKITVGNRSVTIYLTLGHTPGTVSSISRCMTMAGR